MPNYSSHLEPFQEENIGTTIPMRSEFKIYVRSEFRDKARVSGVLRSSLVQLNNSS